MTSFVDRFRIGSDPAVAARHDFENVFLRLNARLAYTSTTQLKAGLAQQSGWLTHTRNWSAVAELSR